MDLDDLLNLPNDVRALTLVGLYLRSWSVMESSLNHAIERAFRLSSLEGAILTKNTQFRDKIHILKTIIDTRVVDQDVAAGHKTTLNQISNLAPDRNMVAHDAFSHTDDGDGVKFYVIKAKGSISIPPT